jgi:septal ring factor EnvC (AmiA/AmiB activator)
MANGHKERWHVGKEIPLAVVLTMILQAVAIVWFAAKMDNQIDVNAASITRNDVKIEKANTKIDDLYDAIAEQNVINARLDITMQNIDRTLESVNRRMESEVGR